MIYINYNKLFVEIGENCTFVTLAGLPPIDECAPGLVCRNGVCGDYLD